MSIFFDLNLDHAYAETLRQHHEPLQAQELITELEDKVGAAVNLVLERHGVLPAIGDRVQVDEAWMVVRARTFGQEGSVWLSVAPFEA